MSFKNIIKTFSESDDQWSDEVETKWTPPEGLFENGTAEEIADAEYKGHKDLKSAMASLNFYLNRGGENIPEDRRKVIEEAKELVRQKYESTGKASFSKITKKLGNFAGNQRRPNSNIYGGSSSDDFDGPDTEDTQDLRLARLQIIRDKDLSKLGNIYKSKKALINAAKDTQFLSQLESTFKDGDKGKQHVEKIKLLANDSVEKLAKEGENKQAEVLRKIKAIDNQKGLASALATGAESPGKEMLEALINWVASLRQSSLADKIKEYDDSVDADLLNDPLIAETAENNSNPEVKKQYEKATTEANKKAEAKKSELNKLGKTKVETKEDVQKLAEDLCKANHPNDYDQSIVDSMVNDLWKECDGNAGVVAQRIKIATGANREFSKHSFSSICKKLNK